MMTMSYVNNNNNSSNVNYFANMNSLECELGDIYSAPEIMHNSDIISITKQLTLKSLNSNNKVSECSSTDCSSNSDNDDDEELQTIMNECAAKLFFKSTSQTNQSLQNSESTINENTFNNSGLRKHKCIKPSLFNPERESILSKQNNSDDIELPILERRVSQIFEKVDENYYKIALMNCALKFNYPEELLIHLQKRSPSFHMKRAITQSIFEDDSNDYLADVDEDEINGLSEEELLQDLYSAPEIL